MATTAVAFVDLGPFSVVAALAIAVCKMLLVALFFMHVRHSTKLTGWWCWADCLAGDSAAADPGRHDDARLGGRAGTVGARAPACRMYMPDIYWRRARTSRSGRCLHRV